MYPAQVVFGVHTSAEETERLRADLAEVGFSLDGVRIVADEGGPGDYPIWLAAALIPLLNAFLSKAGEDAWSVFRRVFYLNLRGRNGAIVDRNVRLTDSTRPLSVVINSGAPDEALGMLLELNTQGLLDCPPGEQRSIYWGGPQQSWLVEVPPIHPEGRWWGRHPGEPWSRRLPIRPARIAVPASAVPDPPAGDAELSRLDKAKASLVIVTLQRAAIVRRWLRGTPLERIAGAMAVSDELVQATVLDFVEHGPAALKPDFADGVAPRFDDDIADQIVNIVRSVPKHWRKRRTIAYQADDLVRTGTVEDIGHGMLHRILIAEDIDLPLR